MPSFSNFILETISSLSFIKTYQNPLSAEEHMTASKFCNTKRILVAEEKCLKTYKLPDGFHANTQSPVHRLHANFFSKQFCLEESRHNCALCPLHKCNIHTHKPICTTVCPAMKHEKHFGTPIFNNEKTFTALERQKD